MKTASRPAKSAQNPKNEKFSAGVYPISAVEPPDTALPAGFAKRLEGGSQEHKRMTRHYPTGLDGRMRDADGEIRKKRSDTLIRTVRDEYGDGVAAGYRSDAKLGRVLDKEGLTSLDQLLKKGR
jgi:hypothetical protein